jgi:peptidoglycan L-alanyl-D-glutamate endopeptidase CwlK
MDSRSARNVATLLPKAQALAKEWYNRCHDQGLKVVIICGTRTYAEQDALYKQPHDGKDNDGDGRVDEADEFVTNAEAGESNHNFGIAWDFCLFPQVVETGGKGPPIYESPDYLKAGLVAESLGLEWGGRWKKPKDEPHIQIRTGLKLAEMRRRVANGIPIV